MYGNLNRDDSSTEKVGWPSRDQVRSVSQNHLSEVDLDGIVDAGDFGVAFAGDELADISGDGVVDAADFGIMFAAFNKTNLLYPSSISTDCFWEVAWDNAELE